MGKEGDYKISEIYQGGYSSLSPPADWTSNNYIRAGDLSMTTDPRTANILQEVSSKLSGGLKNIEITAIQPEILDAIPDKQLKEVRRLSKLTGIDVSMHGPLIEASGVTQQGFSESEREIAERKIAHALIRSRDLNPDGNIPVTFHSSAGIPGSQFLPPSEKEKSKKEGIDTIYRKMIAVNRETGKMIPLEPDVQYHPESENLKTGEILTPEDKLRLANSSEWDNSTSQLIFNKERADEILEKNRPLIQQLVEDLDSGKLKERGIVSPEQANAWRHYKNANAYLKDVHKQINSLFSKAYEFSTDDSQKQILEGFSENFKKQIEGNNDPFIQSQAMNELLHGLKQTVPKIYVPVEEFAVEKSGKTYGSAAFEAYKKFKGEHVPMMVIENPPAGGGLSTGEDIKNIVVASRDSFIVNAMKSKKEGGLEMSEDVARKQAEKLIGATWDVGHINMLRGQGYSSEEIVKETEKVAPYVKHVHLSDNFGMEHTELPMGMGNVPLKEMMEKLGKKGFEAKKVIEAAHWWQHMKNSPFQESLEGVGSPVYQMDMAPYWNQAGGLYQGYMSGLDGAWLPQTNYETFGTGFSRLPKELGGNVQESKGNRMSGRPME
ncbi:MAG: hypothetical protein KKB79_03345 [Nanoarchaeota archaeon]|nr:hypothetical protein [Nanoarchaeota archaeon]